MPKRSEGGVRAQNPQLTRLYPASMERMRLFAFDWTLLIYLRNAALLTLVAGGLHLRLYIKRAQGQKYKFSNSRLAKDDRKPLQEPDLGQRVLEPRQRMRDLVRLRGRHTVGVRQQPASDRNSNREPERAIGRRHVRKHREPRRGRD